MPFAYLDIDNPVCAWAVYRGKLVLSPNDPGFTSVWLTGLCRGGDVARYNRESALEIVRAQLYPQCVSRLRCIFGFETKVLADRAQEWDKDGRTHFQPKYLANLCAENPSTVSHSFDANWISHSEELTDNCPEWMERYWSGEAFPDSCPHWETLYNGALIVNDCGIRQSAYQLLESEFSKSLALLEFSRLAACVGSDLGMVTPFLRQQANRTRLDYIINLVDAKNEVLFKKMRAYASNSGAVKWQNIQSDIPWEDCGQTPDLSSYGMSWDIGSFV